MRERIESLQVLRGIAAVMVVYLHASGLKLPSETWKPDRFEFGAAGVDLFFVLSGVIISIVAKGSPLEFARRRFWRIVPLYWLLTLLTLPLNPEAGLTNVLTSLTFWPAWGTMTSPVLGIGWTLNFEILFYLCAALVLIDRRIGYVLAALYAAFFSARHFTDAPAFQFVGNPIILEFIAGLVIGYWWQRGSRLRYPVAMVGAGLGLLLGLPDIYSLANPFDTMTGETSLQRAFFVGVPSALIVWGFLNLQVRWPKFLIDLGDASYSIYLAHAVIMYPLSYTLLPGILQTYSLPFHLFMFGWTSFFCYQWIEKPLLERIRHRRRREAEAELAPSGAPA